ncbi:MAG: ACP phosphodiesterase [Rudaea sp.]|uniref:acyl carrier protein phosphodiesterase n=1 Tax=Rudaea sp. TaxID=2136325 RepID=UPI0039E5041A
MNHLAHVLLAGSNIDMQLGGLLADFWRGAPDPAWRERVRAGLALHRKIDAYTDNHPAVARLRKRFEPPFRRYAGILLDIYFDHALARRWNDYASEPLDAVSERALRLVDENRDWLPPDLLRFARYMHANSLFAAYAERAMIEQVLIGVSQRLRHANPLAEAGPVLWKNAAALDAGFAEFFSQLQAEALRLRLTLLPPSLEPGLRQSMPG